MFYLVFFMQFMLKNQTFGSLFDDVKSALIDFLAQFIDNLFCYRQVKRIFVFITLTQNEKSIHRSHFIYFAIIPK